LFELEAGYTEKRLSFQERFQARKEYSFPIAEEFFAWAKMRVCPKICVTAK
jgi:hypothetical protein